MGGGALARRLEATIEAVCDLSCDPRGKLAALSEKMLLATLAQLMGLGILLRPFRSSYPASVAQLVEHLICNLEVMGSSPIASSSSIQDHR